MPMTPAAPHAPDIDLAAILHHVSDAVIVVDAHGKIMLWNRAAAALYGWAATEALGHAIADLLPLRAADPAAQAIAQATWQTGVWPEVTLVASRDGTLHTISGSSHIQHDAHGGVAQIAHLTRAVALHPPGSDAQALLQIMAAATKHFAAATSNLDELYRAVATYIAAMFDDLCSLRVISPDGLHLIPGHTAHLDPQAQPYIDMIDRFPQRVDEGHSRQVVQTGQPLLIPVVPATTFRRALPVQGLAYFDRFGISSILVVPLLLHGQVIGTLSLVRSRPNAPYDNDDQALLQELASRVALAIGYARSYDAEQRVRRAAEAAMAAKDAAFALLDTLFATAPIGLAFVDRDLRFKRVNDALADINGITAAQHLNRQIREVLPELAPILEPIYRDVINTGKPYVNIELSGEALAAPWHQRHWLASYYPVFGPSAAILGVGVVINEITERVRTEAALRESERRFRSIAENADDIMFHFRLDPPGFEYINTVITRVTGYTPEDHYQADFNPLRTIHPDDHAAFSTFMQQLTHGTQAITLRSVHTNGMVSWLEHRAWVIYDDHGQPIAHEGIARDVTASNIAAQRLRQDAADLHALSVRLVHAQEDERRALAHELHDEIGQLLTGLNMALEADDAAPATQLRAQLRDVQQVVTDLTSRVRQLSLDLRPAMLDDLGLLPTLLWHMRRYSEQTHIQIDFKHHGLDRALPPHVAIAAYRIIQEGLTNIARYAQVATASVQVLIRQQQLTIMIEDDGRGFDVARVMQARRSLGLIGMRERATLLGGQCTIDAAPGGGTRILATLPLDGPATTHEEHP